MKPKTRFTQLSLLILLTGCASTSTPIQYDNSHNRAHNIAHAGGLYHFNVAIETVLQKQSIHYERTNGNSEQKIEFYIHSADYQCPKYQAGMTNRDLCYITAEVFEPRRTMSPSFVNDGQESYAFESHSSISLRDT